MGTMETNLLDRMLDTYQAAQTPVTVTLQNKIRVTGKIKAFDSYIIVIDGQKRGVVYRHAVSCIAANPEEKPRQPEPPVKQAPQNPPAKFVKPSPQKPRRQPPPAAALSVSAGESGINNSMKEGLLKWMREQKASK